MNARILVALAFALLVAAVPAAAYPYLPYGDFGYDYERSSTSESVTSHESEYQSSSSTFGGGRYYHGTDAVNYGRSRDFSFSRTADYARESTGSGYGGYPFGFVARDSSAYAYPYYDTYSGEPRDYRPYHDYYEMSFTSPYYNPHQYSRVGAYASRYLPYGY